MKKAAFQNKGSLLIVAAMIMCWIFFIVGMAMTLSWQSNRLSQRAASLEGAQAVADGYMDWAYGYWRSVCKGQANMAVPTSSFNLAANMPPTGLLSNPSGISIITSSTSGVPATEYATQTNGAYASGSSYQIVAVSPQLLDQQTPNTGAGQTYAGVATSAQMQSSGDAGYFYLAMVDLQVPTIHGNVIVRVRRVFEKQLMSPWQYAIFYTDELEFHPSPPFVVNGWVHSNGDLFPSPDGGNTLTFGDKVDYSGFYYDGYMPPDGAWRGRTQDSTALPNGQFGYIGAADSFTPGLPPAQSVAQDPVGVAPNQFTPSNPNDTSYREIIEAPVAGYTDTFTNDSDDPANPRYYNQAGLRITIDSSNNITVIGQDGNAITAANVSTASTADKAMYTNTIAAITTNGLIDDQREAQNVRVTTLDVSLLNTSKIGATWNNVVWISDQSVGTSVKVGSTSGVTRRGIRVKNGANVPSGGISVITDNPMYVQGDFNTGTTWQPSLLAGDAINVLSNAWSDANSSNSTAPTATVTTINAAFLTGNTPTQSIDGTSKNYSGGVENFPRFHENWSNVNFNYNGSMVEMFPSEQATGRWATANYSPPIRNWAFDNRFRSTPPPGTLLTTTYLKHAWFLR